MDLGMKAWWDRVRSGLSPRKAGSSPAPVPRWLLKVYTPPTIGTKIRDAMRECPPRETREASEDSPGLAPPAARNGASHSIIESLALSRDEAARERYKIAYHAMHYSMGMEEFRAAIERDEPERA